MTPAEYRDHLSDALVLTRSGHEPESVALHLGGDAAWWETLLFAADEHHTDPIREAVMDMRGAGFSIDRICLSLELSRSEVLAALNTERRYAPQIPVWDKEQQRAVLADYDSGLTLRQIARKHGYSSPRVALAAIERMKRRK